MFRCVALCSLLLASSAYAQLRSVALAVPGMTCPTCPLALKKALLAERGVKTVTVHYEQKRLDVAFDDAVVTQAAILKATERVGFPSTILSQSRP